MAKINRNEIQIIYPSNGTACIPKDFMLTNLVKINFDQLVQGKKVEGSYPIKLLKLVKLTQFS